MTSTAYVVIQGVTGTPTTSMAALSDSFGDSSIDSSKWTSFHYSMAGSSVSEGSGGLQFTLAGAEGDIGIISNEAYDLTGSYAIVELNDAGRAADVDGSGFGLMVQAEAGDVWPYTIPSIQWWVQAGLLWASWEADGTQNPIDSQTYNSTDHKWLRLREDSGTTYFDTSADGGTWVNQYSLANPIAVTSLYATLISLQWDTSGTTTAELSNFNPSGGAAAVASASAVVFDSGGSVTGKYSVTAPVNAGDTNETIRDAIVSAVQTAAGDDTLVVEYLAG